MSWQAILGVPVQSSGAPIQSHNSQNAPSWQQAPNFANSANAFDRSANAAEPSPSFAPLPIETDFAERAAIIEYEAGVPGEWADGYTRLLCLPPPAGIGPDRWQQIADDGGRFLADWGKQAARLGWTTLEVFGVSPRAPEHRLDMRGLVPALGGQRIIMLTAEAATVDTGGVKPLRIFRRAGEEAVTVWDLRDCGNPK